MKLQKKGNGLTSKIKGSLLDEKRGWGNMSVDFWRLRKAQKSLSKWICVFPLSLKRTKRTCSLNCKKANSQPFNTFQTHIWRNLLQQSDPILFKRLDRIPKYLKNLPNILVGKYLVILYGVIFAIFGAMGRMLKHRHILCWVFKQLKCCPGCQVCAAKYAAAELSPILAREKVLPDFFPFENLTQFWA